MAPKRSYDSSEQRNSKRQKRDEEESSELIALPQLSEYERIRLENIKRNETFLSDLGVSSVRSNMATTIVLEKSKKARKPVGGIKSSLLPTRRSSRVTVEKLNSEIKLLQNQGRVEEAAKIQEELDSVVAKQKEGAYVPGIIQADNEESTARLSADPIFLKSIRDDLEEGEEVHELVADLKNALQFSTNSTKRHEKKNAELNSSDLEPTAKEFSKMKLIQSDVVKLTAARITAVGISPSTEHVVAVAGDKYGNLGLWNASKPDDEFRIFKYRPHISNIIHFHFTEEDVNKLFSLSYDGTIRTLDLQRELFSLAFEAPEGINDLYYSDGTFLTNKPQSAIIAKSNGNISLIDFRSSNSRYEWDFVGQDCRINSIQQHPTEPNLLVSAGTRNGRVAVHDIRNASKNWKPLSFFAAHTKSINAAYVSPDGAYLISISLDDTIRAWKNFTGVGKVVSHSYRHNNFTGRWLSTFRPSFDPKRKHTFICGSMLQPRRIELFTIQDSSSAKLSIDLMYNLQSEFLASVNSRNCFHPKLEMVLGSNSSGKVHLFR